MEETSKEISIKEIEDGYPVFYTNDGMVFYREEHRAMLVEDIYIR